MPTDNAPILESVRALNDFSSKTVLITGAGIGIGRATAKAFGAAGYRVIVTDVLPDEGASVVGEISAAGGSAEFHPLDVTSTEAPKRPARSRAEFRIERAPQGKHSH